jgi:hypothetical protein
VQRRVYPLQEDTIALDEETDVDERREQRLADQLIQVPEPLRLTTRQPEAWHFAELRFDTAEHLVHRRRTLRLVSRFVHAATLSETSDDTV